MTTCSPSTRERPRSSESRAAARFTPTAEPTRPVSRRGVLDALEREQRRAHEQLEADERRDRVAR